ncbi:MAG: efflux RND transporter periplasmic adaptor subunit [Gammaproteobacteria bacterium]|nr:efflux RND transporter periplasmic adaptor subunit [Gammaproteobacteria bacterium]
MANYKSTDLQTWLKLLCQMLPGFGQAVLLTDSCEQTDSMIRWPADIEPHDDLISTASLAAAQNKSVTTTLSSDQRNDSATDMIIALPLTRIDNFNGTLAVLANIKPSQQSVVMQILHWGENWLGLLFDRQQPATPPPEESAQDRTGGLVHSGRSRLVALGMALLLGVMTFTSGNYRVTASANLEGKIQRAIVAPFDGYIAAAHARAGETVAAGEVIAALDTEELLLQKQRHAAEKNEYTRQYRKALSTRDQTQAHIFKSQVSQAEAQLELVEKKIERAALVSTLDGVIISGDLSRSLGAPVATGDVLFEVAPLDEYRLIILVDEKQVADVDEGLSGGLTLKALPDTALPFVVHRVSPVFQQEADGIAYRVEARLVEHHAALRPGMEGIAKIDVDRRSLIWIYLHELFDLMRLWAWRWLP